MRDDLDRFPRSIRLVSVDLEKNRHRFYELRWEESLFEGPVLVRQFGRLGTAGRTLARSYPNQESAQKEIQQLIRRRLHHGYQLAE